MRGDDRHQGMMFSYISPELRVPQDHPLRTIRRLVDTVLADLSPQFGRLYSDVGRPYRFDTMKRVITHGFSAAC